MLKERNCLTVLSVFALFFLYGACVSPKNEKEAGTQKGEPMATLQPVDPIYFKSFVDCNMAEVWIADTFRIFPGKYGEDPVWGYSHELKFADGDNITQAFQRKHEEFTEPRMPPNAPPGVPGLHGAVWFETVYQDEKDKSGKTLYAIYHNENYPETLPYDSVTGKGYINHNWPQGLTGPKSPAAVCRIGVMKSSDGGHSWTDRGIFIEDLQPRMILKPFNASNTFAGGVGDPSAVVSGEWLYLFYGEYGYPGIYDSATYDRQTEWRGQCISVARIKISDLDNPEGKAKRWDGKGFNAPFDGIGAPVKSLQVPLMEGGGPASSAEAGFHWGPSVSWNTYLNAWVMMMGKSTGPSWQGSGIYISYNTNTDLGESDHSQQWSKPLLLLEKPGHIIWYPSLQPPGTDQDRKEKNTCLKSGKTARLYFKDMTKDTAVYVSEYLVRFGFKNKVEH